MSSEFDLIRRYFTRPAMGATLGIGDDCALLTVPYRTAAAGKAENRADTELAVSTDMLVRGVHFIADARADWLGHKALAVNLSDLAAMGATPCWALLALAMPAADETWLARFCAGFFAVAERYGVELIGGDTTRGPLNICITVGGELPAGTALRRDAAQTGDDIWVSGTLGDAALALAQLRGDAVIAEADLAALSQRLHRPTPRIEAGLALRGVAHAAIDVSDGLAADLGHILERSGRGASIRADGIPLSPEFARHAAHVDARRWMLAGGDDYELCFTAPQAARERIAAIARQLDLRMTLIGRIEAEPGLRIHGAGGEDLPLATSGYDHFR